MISFIRHSSDQADNLLYDDEDDDKCEDEEDRHSHGDSNGICTPSCYVNLARRGCGQITCG